MNTFTKPKHITAADVAAAGDCDDVRAGRATRLQHLPLYARVAIEWLDGRTELRSTGKLDDVLQHSANACGASVDLQTCAAAHAICAARFSNFD